MAAANCKVAVSLFKRTLGLGPAQKPGGPRSLLTAGRLLREGRPAHSGLPHQPPANMCHLHRVSVSPQDAMSAGLRTCYRYLSQTSRSFAAVIQALDGELRIFFLDIPDDVAMERLSLRMTDPVSGERYHTLYRPAPRMEVHERLQQKPADSEQKVQARLDVYHASAEDLEEFYQDVIHINADQDPHTVWEFIESCVISPRPQRVPGEPASP